MASRQGFIQGKTFMQALLGIKDSDGHVNRPSNSRGTLTYDSVVSIDPDSRGLIYPEMLIDPDVQTDPDAY